MVKLFGKKGKAVESVRIKLDLNLKNIPTEEYSHIMKAYQISMTQFERNLKESLVEGYVSISALDKITQAFNFPELRQQEIPSFASVDRIIAKGFHTTPRPLPEQVLPQQPAPIQPTSPAPTPEPAPTVDSPLIQHVAREKKPEFTPKKPVLTFETKSQVAVPSSPKPVPTQPLVTELKKPTINIPNISLKSAPTPSISPLGSGPKRSEEDRATGIAILRKQMLSELKKIRTVVSESDEN